MWRALCGPIWSTPTRLNPAGAPGPGTPASRSKGTGIDASAAGATVAGRSPTATSTSKIRNATSASTTILTRTLERWPAWMMRVVRRRPAHAVRLALLTGLALAVAASLLVAGRSRPDKPGVALVPAPPRDRHFEPVRDPFAWDPARADDFVRLAARGTSHVLYARSPGGVLLSAARTARYRPLVERAARRAKVDPDLLEGLVYLEGGGRPDAIAPAGPGGAVGLPQILAETGQALLGMHVDVAASRRYTRRIARERRRLRLDRVAQLEAARRRADQRYEPAAALSATARYLIFAKRRLGRDDLAFAAYHMGVGNLEGVLRLYAGEPGDGPVAGLVERRHLSYARVYFDSTPRRHAAAYRRL